MNFSDLFDRLLLKPYQSAGAETYHQARDLAFIMLAIAAVIGATLGFSNAEAAVRLSMVGLIALCGVVLAIIKLGLPHVATFSAVLLMGGLSSTIFFRGDFYNYEVYALTSIHLCILLIATMLTYRKLYAYVSMGIGIGVIVIHHVTRALPQSLPGNAAEFDDFIACVGLILVSGMVAARIVHRRRELTEALGAESEENRLRATSLQQSKTLLNAVIDQSPIPMIVAAPDGTILNFNNALQSYVGDADISGLQTGRRLTDLDLGWSVYDTNNVSVAPDEMPLRSALDGVTTPGKEMRFVLRDGNVKWAIQHAAPIYDAAGNMVAGFSAFADITERKRAEEATRESEARYRNLIQHSGEAIYLLYNRKFEVVNSRFEEMFGVSLTDAEDPTFDFMNLVAPKSRPVVEDRMKRFGMGEQLEPTYEFTALTPDGREVDVEATVSYIRYRDGVATQGILRDVTDRNRLEEQLRQSQKMEAVGRLAGGVAHDFNNLLTVIIGYSELLQDDDLPPDTVAHVKEIQQAGESAKRLTSQLLAFSRKQITQPKVIAVNDLIHEHNKMLGRLLGENIEIVTKLDAGSDQVLIDPGQMEQVVMNVAVNARDAMPFGGTLTLSTENLEINSESPAPEPEAEPGQYLLLSITDTGVGMNESTRLRAFEPFFTTKGREKGTGLGLSTVYGIVKQNNGFIEVASEPEQGTTFRIFLPLVRSRSATRGVTEGRLLTMHGSETILLVEDDEGVRSFVQSILSRNGYTVLAAENGEAAVRVFQEHVNDVDLVVTDVVMPLMSGRELMDHIKPLKPELKCIYVSGYTDEAIVHHGVLDEGIELIQKPFSGQRLLTKIREVLD